VATKEHHHEFLKGGRNNPSNLKAPAHRNSEWKYQSGVQRLGETRKPNSASSFSLHLIHDFLSTCELPRVEPTGKRSNLALFIM